MFTISQYSVGIGFSVGLCLTPMTLGGSNPAGWSFFFNGGHKMDQRRTEQRHRTLKSAKITFSHGAAIDCVVRNLSHNGACLGVVSPLGVPETFLLVLDSDHSSRPCRVAWRTERRIGVSFE
jgi:hypothetical protein